MVAWAVIAPGTGGLNLKRDGHLGHYPFACSRRDVHFSSNPTYRYSTQLYLGFLRGEVGVVACTVPACNCDYVHVCEHYVLNATVMCWVCATNGKEKKRKDYALWGVD